MFINNLLIISENTPNFIIFFLALIKYTDIFSFTKTGSLKDL